MGPELLNKISTTLISDPQNSEARRAFYANHIFHERQMNSCPIGCQGCAVSAKLSGAGSIAFCELEDFYQDAHKLGVSLQITKVEGYDPVFTSYSDDKTIPFAQSLASAVDLGHSIITPVCTTGSWKSERSLWQLEELGKLPSRYRYFRYPSGNSGDAFVLSVPREIRPFASKYSFDEHLGKLTLDINLLTANGNLDVLIYYNNNLASDRGVAEDIKSTLEARLSPSTLSKANLIISNFNSNTIPESCFRYSNSVLFSDKGFTLIDEVSMEWTESVELIVDEIPKKLVNY